MTSVKSVPYCTKDYKFEVFILPDGILGHCFDWFLLKFRGQYIRHLAS